jgi:hypothetical protein
MSANGSAAELKVQGVEESARDPNTSTTANDAQRKIVDESKKAGVAAFTFDPNATPEQKAAQARAVSNLVLCSNYANDYSYSVCQRVSITNINLRVLPFPRISTMASLELITFPPPRLQELWPPKLL